MAGELRQNLRERTAIGKVVAEQRRAEIELEVAAEERSYERHLAGIKGAATKKFLSEKLADELTAVSHAVVDFADAGHGSMRKAWTIQHSGTYGDPPAEDLRLHRALRDRVAKHFRLQGLDVVAFEYEPQERDWSIPLSDGYSEDCPPTKLAGYTQIGMTLKWAD